MHLQWLEVAERQAGVISTAQLIAAGVDRNGLRRLVRQGTVHPADRAVWVSTSILDACGDNRRSLLWIKLLGAGSHAFAWRRSAAALWGLDGFPWPESPEIAVGFPDHPRRATTPRLRSLDAGDVTVVDGVPATGPARTLADLAVLTDLSAVERALECALRRGLVSVGDLTRSVAGRRSAGARRLVWMLASRPDGTPPTESDAETLFLIVARSMGLPTPHRQFAVLLRGRRFRLDFAWPDVRLAVEVDGAAVHGPGELDSDLRRQNAILLDGWLVLRFSWWTVTNRPDHVRRDLRVAWATRTALAVGR